MKVAALRIEELGFDSWFQEKADPLKVKELKFARVVSVDKNSYLITNGTGDVFAELTGKMLFNAAEAPDLPVVGDWVYAQFFDEDTFAVIHDIFPRKSVLKRKTAGKKIDVQLIAANIDTALIMQSLDSNFNINRLERYLVMSRDGRIDPLVLLSKSDLISPDDLDLKMAEVLHRIPNIQTIAFSNERPADPDRIRDMLVPGKTYCLLGSSGVGKTTLLNKLLKEERFETREVRGEGRKGKAYDSPPAASHPGNRSDDH